MVKITVVSFGQQKSGRSIPPYVRVELSEFSKNAEGRIFISPQLLNAKEIDETIDGLIDQLEEARNKAKKELQWTK